MCCYWYSGWKGFQRRTSIGYCCITSGNFEDIEVESPPLGGYRLNNNDSSSHSHTSNFFWIKITVCLKVLRKSYLPISSYKCQLQFSFGFAPAAICSSKNSCILGWISVTSVNFLWKTIQHRLLFSSIIDLQYSPHLYHISVHSCLCFRDFIN